MLQNDAMVVRLSISKWTARKFDKAITKRVASEFGTADDAGRYNKVLIAKEAVQAIDKVANAARTYHYENTLPWDDVGGRLLPSKHFMDYSKKMREFEGEFDTAVQDFIRNYPTYRDEAQRRLNGMFNPADYPAPFEIASKFGFYTDIEPVPSSEDFRVDIQSSERAKIKKQIEESSNRRLKEATDDLFRRLADVVGHFSEKLQDTDAIFRNSLVENVVELVNLLPKLNVNADPELESIRKEVSKKLVKHDPDTLRNDKAVRTEAANDAKDILAKMDGYLGKRK